MVTRRLNIPHIFNNSLIHSVDARVLKSISIYFHYICWNSKEFIKHKEEAWKILHDFASAKYFVKKNASYFLDKYFWENFQQKSYNGLRFSYIFVEMAEGLQQLY